MRKILIVGVIILLVIAGLFVIPIGESTEVESSFGNWIVNISVVDENGETQELSSSQCLASKLLDVNVGGSKASYIVFEISARATGEGYSTCHLVMDTMNVGADVKDFGGVVKYSYAPKYGDSNVYLDVNGAEKLVFSYTIYMENIDIALSEGDYTIDFIPSGEVEFRGEGNDGNGEWESCDLPPGASLSVSITSSPRIRCYRCVGSDVDVRMFDGTSCPSGWVEDPPNCGGNGNGGNVKHTLTVTSFPRFASCTCNGVTKTSYPAEFELYDGSYTVRGVHNTYGTRTKTVTMSGSDRSVTLWFKDPMSIVAFSFGLIPRDVVLTSYYTDSTHYLGER